MKTIQKVMALLLLLTLFSPVHAGPHSERWYQTKWCLEQDGEMEVTLPDRTRCDCITKTHAVEIEFADNKWYQAIGQSLHYALQTNKRPGILLIIESPKNRKYWERLNRVIKTYNLPIDVWTIGDGVN